MGPDELGGVTICVSLESVNRDSGDTYEERLTLNCPL